MEPHRSPQPREAAGKPVEISLIDCFLFVAGVTLAILLLPALLANR